jgi:multiple antibiotic resistance protein
VRSRLPVIAAALTGLCCDTAAAADGAESLTLELGKIFTFFFLTLGPKAVIAPFARSTAALATADRRKVALAATGISLFAVLIAATIGVRVLNNWGISTGALLVAAGVILFLVALDSIRSQYAVADDIAPSAAGAATSDGTRPGAEAAEPSIRRLGFRIAFPYVVSPHGVAVVILVLSTRPESVPLTPILAMLGGIMLLDFVVMLNARRIAGSAYVAPVMAVVGSVLGVLQAALGVQAVLTGLDLAAVF